MLSEQFQWSTADLSNDYDSSFLILTPQRWKQCCDLQQWSINTWMWRHQQIWVFLWVGGGYVSHPVCLSVNGISQKVINWFRRNFLNGFGGCVTRKNWFDFGEDPIRFISGNKTSTVQPGDGRFALHRVPFSFSYCRLEACSLCYGMGRNNINLLFWGKSCRSQSVKKYYLTWTVHF